jgi:hypothetical protein
MSNLYPYCSETTQKNKCKKAALHKYLGKVFDCGELDCPVHGKGRCLLKYNNALKQKSIKGCLTGFRPFIVSFVPKTNEIDICIITNQIRDILRKFDQRGWIKIVSHITAKNPHINFGVASRYLHSDYEKTKKRKLKKRYSWELAWSDIQKLVSGCVRHIKFGYKRYFDRPQGWLHYILRLEQGDSFHKRKEYGRGCDGRSYSLSRFLILQESPISKEGRAICTHP